MLATIVDTGALLQVVWVSLLAAVGLTVLFTGGVLLASGPSASPARRGAGGVLIAVCAAAVVLGLYVLFVLK